MCLTVKKDLIETFTNKLFPEGVNQVACYKVLMKPQKECGYEWEYYSPLFMYSHQWIHGWNVSSHKINGICSGFEGFVTTDEGIHVFTNYESAKLWRPSKKAFAKYFIEYVIIKVTCLKEDLILCDNERAVFKKVLVESFEEVTE